MRLTTTLIMGVNNNKYLYYYLENMNMKIICFHLMSYSNLMSNKIFNIIMIWLIKSKVLDLLIHYVIAILLLIIFLNNNIKHLIMLLIVIYLVVNHYHSLNTLVKKMGYTHKVLNSSQEVLLKLQQILYISFKVHRSVRLGDRINTNINHKFLINFQINKIWLNVKK